MIRNLVIMLLSLGLLLLVGCGAGQMQVLTTPLLQAQPLPSGPSNGDEISSTNPPWETQPLQSGSEYSNDNMIYPATSMLAAQPFPGGSETSDTDGKFLEPIDRYDIVQFSHAIGDELAAINCYSGGKQIANLYFMNIDTLPANFVTTGEKKIAALYYHYNRYNDILEMFRTGSEIYLIYFDQNNARIESRNIAIQDST